MPGNNAPVASAASVLVTPPGPPRTVPKGSAGVAQAPSEDGTLKDWTGAAVYNISITTAGGQPPPPAYDLRLVMNYTGDVARVYLGGTLISDNFYNGGLMTAYHVTEAASLALPCRRCLRAGPEPFRGAGHL